MWDEPQSMSSDAQGMLKSISQGCVSNLNSATASLGAWVATCSVPLWHFGVGNDSFQ